MFRSVALVLPVVLLAGCVNDRVEPETSPDIDSYFEQTFSFTNSQNSLTYYMKWVRNDEDGTVNLCGAPDVTIRDTWFFLVFEESTAGLWEPERGEFTPVYHDLRFIFSGDIREQAICVSTGFPWDARFNTLPPRVDYPESVTLYY